MIESHHRLLREGKNVSMHQYKPAQNTIRMQYEHISILTEPQINLTTVPNYQDPDNEISSQSQHQY